MNPADEAVGKVLLVAEGDQTIGRAICEEAARQGWAVAVHSAVDREAARELVTSIRAQGGRAMSGVADLRQTAQVSRLLQDVEQELGPVVGLICDPGAATVQPMLQLDEKLWHETLDSNLLSVFLTIQAVLPGMIEAGFGRLILLSSMAAHTGGQVGAAYAASKAGAEGLMRYYAGQLSSHRITANSISLAVIENEVTRKLIPTTDHLPLGRMGTVEEVAATCAMLLNNGYMTGQTLHLNGGLHFG